MDAQSFIAQCRQEEGEVRVALRVTPRAKGNALDGLEADADGQWRLRVRVTAVPDKGAANAAVIGLLAKQLKQPKRAFRLIRGDQAREKLIGIAAPGDEVAKALAAALK